jgi:hypothetical protein
MGKLGVAAFASLLANIMSKMNKYFLHLGGK